MQLSQTKSLSITIVSAAMLAALAFSWLVFPYYFDGKGMLFDTGEEVRSERYMQQNMITQYLSRYIFFPGGIEVQGLYASDEYFEFADRSGTIEAYRPDLYIIFFITEDVHTGYLPFGMPKAVLDIDGSRYEAVSAEGPEWVEHHRSTIIKFPKFTDQGEPVIKASSTSASLELTHSWDRDRVVNDEVVPVIANYVWELPLNVPENMKSRDTFTSAMVMSLSAGLLSSVLTPCLIQLVLLFFATLGGMSAKEVTSSGTITPEVRKKVLFAASCFVAGYVALFIAFGALVGYAGKEAQIFFATYTRPVGIVSGIIVITFGLWLAIRSRAPLVCNLPGASIIENAESKGVLGTVITAIAFSLGCMSCFGGAIIGTLFIYVGALGSVSAGATVMGIFAAGVAIPFLLSAIFFTRMKSLFEFVAKHTRSIGTLSALVFIAFGILLITDKFHVVSDAIYPYLGLN
ncbi:MAG TPA: hypothetical protein DCY55_12840 [Gammaproteobacteria bacterium]|jgi:cytochrome c biogenesis protein CcdA|nr:hypothetical protein [Gammaproteobacteria bacterium]